MSEQPDPEGNWFVGLPRLFGRSLDRAARRFQVLD